jgi:hypothetical protein
VNIKELQREWDNSGSAAWPPFWKSATTSAEAMVSLILDKPG